MTKVAGTAEYESSPNVIALLGDPGGSVGQILLTNAGGTVVLTQSNQYAMLSSYIAPTSPPVMVPPGLIENLYGNALASPPPPPSPELYSVALEIATQDIQLIGGTNVSCPASLYWI